MKTKMMTKKMVKESKDMLRESMVYGEMWGEMFPRLGFLIKTYLDKAEKALDQGDEWGYLEWHTLADKIIFAQDKLSLEVMLRNPETFDANEFLDMVEEVK